MALFPESNENKLLLTCCRGRMDDLLKAELRHLMTGELNWHRIIERAQKNYIALSLYCSLRKLGENEVPKHVLDRLKEIYLVTVTRNMRFQYALARIIPTLELKGVRVILLKGAALTQMLGQNRVLRPMSDIDILVHERDFRAIRAGLHELGYHLPGTLPDLTERELVEYAHWFDQIKFFGKDGMKIDTHFRLLNMGMPSPDERSVWSRAVPVHIGDAMTLVPSPEDMLLHLCFHANHHHFSKIYQFCDIAEVYEYYVEMLDWEYLLQVVERRKMKTSVYCTLLFTRELLGIPISFEVFDRFKTGYLRRKLFECIWERGIVKYQSRFRFGNLEGAVYYLLEMDGLADKLKFIFKGLFPPLEWLSNRFCAPESKKLYPKYLVSLLAKCLRAAR